MSCVAEDPSVVKWLLDIGADIDRYRRTLDIDKFRGEHPIHKAVNPLMSNGFLSDIWTELTIALCGYPIVKMELDIQARFLPQHPFSCCLIISDRNIWRLPAAQFHF